MPRGLHVISTPSGFGGAERVLQALLREGERRHWDQVVLNPFAHEDRSKRLGAVLEASDYRAYPLKNAAGLARLRAWLVKQIDGFNPDLVHVHLFHAQVAVASNPRGGRPRFLTHHHGDVYAAQGRRVLCRIDRLAGARFDVVVAVSESVRRLLTNRYGYADEKVHVIPNGWEGRPDLRSAPPVDPTIICVGNFRREKGHDVLIRAFSTVRESLPNARLVLLGDGPLRDDLEHLAARLNLTSAVDFVGHVPDIWPHLARSQVCVVPSLSEALGLAALEGGAAARPVVASAVGGLHEVVRHGENGFLVPPGDPAALAVRIIELLSDRQLLVDMGQAGLRLAATKTADAMTSAYFALYEKHLARGGGDHN